MKLADSLVLLGVAVSPLAAPLADEVAPQPRPPQVILGRAAAPQDAPQDDAVPRSLLRDALARQDAKQEAKKDESLAALIKQLGHADAKVRHDAYEALKLRGEKARAALEEARKSDDAETRFAASQLLDRLDAEPQKQTPARTRLRERSLELDEAPPALRRLDGLFDDARLRELHERMVQRFEELFREGDPFGEALRNQGGQGLEMQRHGSGLQLGPGSSFSRAIDENGRKESVKITVDADGRAKAVVEKDGVVSNYEADSFEALKQEHPELLEGFGAMRFSLRLPSERMELPRGSLRVPRVVRPPQSAQPPQPPQLPQDAPQAGDGPRLGVHVEPVDPKVAEYLELEEGVGLRVIEVVPDSAADQLGILKNDLLITVNGRTIRGIADVQAALKDKDPTQADVTVLRKGVKREL